MKKNTEIQELIKLSWNVLKERTQQEIDKLQTEADIFNKKYGNFSVFTEEDCDKISNELKQEENSIYQSKRDFFNICDDFVKQCKKIITDNDYLNNNLKDVEELRTIVTNFYSKYIEGIRNLENQLLKAKAKIIEESKNNTEDAK